MRAVRNGLWDTLGTVSGMMTAAVGSLLIVRSMTPAQYGRFSYFAWGGMTLLALTTLAFPAALTKVSSELRGLGEEQAAHDLTSIVMSGVGLVNGIVAAMLLLWALHGSAADRPYLITIAFFLVPASLASTMAASLRGHEQYRPVSLVDALTSAIQIVLIVIAYLGRVGPAGFVVAVLVPSTLQFPGLLLVRPRQHSLHGGQLGLRLLSRALSARYMKYVVPATLCLLFEVVIWQRSEIFFLARLSTPAQVGFYSLGFTVFAVFLATGRALVNGFFPAVSRDFGAGNWLAIRQKMQHCVAMAVLYAVPVSFGGLLTARRVVELVYGPQMIPSAIVAQILFAGLILGVPGVAYSLMISAVRGIWLQVRLGAGLTVLSVGLDLALTPHFGAVGAAVGNTVTVSAYTIILALLAWRRYQVAIDWTVVASITLVGLATTLVLPGIVQAWLPGLFGLAASMAAGICLYTFSVWRLGFTRRFLRTSL